MQEALAIILVAACAVWLSYFSYRYFCPKPGAKACPGGCCDGPAKATPEDAAGATRTQMISSEDLRRRFEGRTR
jgi:hypothetical protein